MYIKGKKAFIVGNIAMNNCFVDVTDIDCEEDDEVIFFDKNVSAEELATAGNTNLYDLLTSIGSKVKRVIVE